jgi:hypothetical protein
MHMAVRGSFGRGLQATRVFEEGFNGAKENPETVDLQLFQDLCCGDNRSTKYESH